MTDEQPDRYPSHPSGPDLEFDLAHEETSGSGNARPEQEAQHISVATSTPGYGGDLSYDLAHDVPGR